MKFKQAQKKKCVVFGRLFGWQSWRDKKGSNYTKYLRHPIHLFALLACLLACFILGVFVLSSSSLLGTEQIHEPKHNHHANTIIMAEIYIFVCIRRMSPQKMLLQIAC
jgi:hypothetical protein